MSASADFDQYHAACWHDGVKDGRVADVDDAITHLRGLDTSDDDYSLEDCERAASAYVATFDFEDFADQYEIDECIPEIAWRSWCRGFEHGLAYRLLDAMSACDARHQYEIEYTTRLDGAPE